MRDNLDRRKLAELLQLRIELEKRAASISARAARNAKTQEGTTTPESTDALLNAYARTMEQLVDVVERIDAANSRLTLPDGRTLSRALAERRRLQATYATLEQVLEEASDLGNRYSLREIRVIPTIDVPMYRERLEGIARELRELNSALQQVNWTLEA